jgi:hypothetical protein
MPKVNNHPKGENSSNKVNLIGTSGTKNMHRCSPFIMVQMSFGDDPLQFLSFTTASTETLSGGIFTLFIHEYFLLRKKVPS